MEWTRHWSLYFQSNWFLIFKTFKDTYKLEKIIKPDKWINFVLFTFFTFFWWKIQVTPNFCSNTLIARNLVFFQYFGINLFLNPGHDGSLQRNAFYSWKCWSRWTVLSPWTKNCFFLPAWPKIYTHAKNFLLIGNIKFLWVKFF